MRSKAEQTLARWLYDHDVRFEYERWRYVLPSGEGYVPDFWLPDVGTLIEVKSGNVDGLHKPWVLAHLVDREEGLALYVWSYGVLWQAREFGWSSDVLWARCRECSVTYPTPSLQTLTCRGCGGCSVGLVPRELRRSTWRAKDPIRTWSPSPENVRDTGL